MDNYKKLIVWEKADNLAFLIYKATLLFPKEEVFGLTSQLRRAALSVPTNIVEGHSRGRKAEFAHFLDIAIASLAETHYLINFSKRLGYIPQGGDDLERLAQEVGKIIWSFRKSLR